ncbi:helix-turn-helix transcriptional regulator [Streptococcus cristatus]|uniref:helix-turn-helix transcriptional regulator n=1 Tax=Streptococcus cristatus TaxID=45634 RepID=UPI002284B431|nr:helix-turn-helix transcriptional regulator [Streptococcus cristatus]MCY7217431.1 helix-turn-helix transcriptional regulator [Streptococcus cristatus]
MNNRIQELRKRKKLSQEELAEKLEVTRQTIISLEKGRYNASLVLAHRIARFFDLAIEEVFLFEEETS